MSPLAQFITSFLCSLLMVKSALGAPAMAEEQQHQSFDIDYNYSIYDDDLIRNTNDTCRDVCALHCLFIGQCDEPQCANYTCDYDYDYYSYEVTDDTGGGTTLRPSDERHPNPNGTLKCLHGNLTDGMSCHCDKGWFGRVCEVPCTLKCIHGYCQFKEKSVVTKKLLTEEDMICNCESGYEKERCEEKTTDLVASAEAKARKLVLGTCLTVVVLTAIILPIVIYWRKRVIFAMRTVCFFKAKEGNDWKRYDAYISAGTTDRALKFVEILLAPKLEQKGFKLLIPCRDELCGAVISDDIITAMKQSRKIIMVVTPEYLQNDWNGFKLLCAQVEMTTLLQKQIIPVILEDVSKEAAKIPKSLKHILDSGKCLKVPEYRSALPDLPQKPSSKEEMDKFWHCLELAMSKDRELNNSHRSNCYIQNGLSDDSYSKNVPDLQISTNRDQTYNSVEVDLGDSQTENYDRMVNSKINPLPVDK